MITGGDDIQWNSTIETYTIAGINNNTTWLYPPGEWIPSTYPTTDIEITIPNTITTTGINGLNTILPPDYSKYYKDIINIKDPDKEKIFEVGKLYRLAPDAPKGLKLEEEKALSQLFPTKTDALLCLGSEREEVRCPICVTHPKSNKRKPKIANRAWKTKFLFKEKFYYYYWYENPELVPLLSPGWYGLELQSAQHLELCE